MLYHISVTSINIVIGPTYMICIVINYMYMHFVWLSWLFNYLNDLSQVHDPTGRVKISINMVHRFGYNSFGVTSRTSIPARKYERRQFQYASTFFSDFIFPKKWGGARLTSICVNFVGVKSVLVEPTIPWNASNV